MLKILKKLKLHKKKGDVYEEFNYIQLFIAKRLQTYACVQCTTHSTYLLSTVHTYFFVGNKILHIIYEKQNSCSKVFIYE